MLVSPARLRRSWLWGWLTCSTSSTSACLFLDLGGEAAGDLSCAPCSDRPRSEAAHMSRHFDRLPARMSWRVPLPIRLLPAVVLAVALAIGTAYVLRKLNL